jgi:plasmid stabilization system protein ParE
MSRIELALELGEDFDRILDHLAQYQVENPELRIREIINALDVLEHNPRIGRPISNGKRELVIGRRPHGYIALYRYIAEIDAIFILAVRSQREAGHTERGQGSKAP